MADTKDAAAKEAATAAKKAASEPPKDGKSTAKESEAGKDRLARAWRILRKSMKPCTKRKRSGKKNKDKVKKKRGRWEAYVASHPKLLRKIKLHKKVEKKERAAKNKIIKEVRATEPPKPVKGKKRPAPKENQEKEDGTAKKKKRSANRHRLHKYKYSGVMKFARPFKSGKRGTWKVRTSEKKKSKPKKPFMVKKEIGGDKNGGFRMVLRKKRRAYYPTADPIRKRTAKALFKNHKRYIRKSLKPGTVLILLCGPHRGKRVVLLKILPSGSLVVNGPKTYNGCPLRRMNQNYVIATRTRLELPCEIPGHIDDKYFKRDREVKRRKKTKKQEIFPPKKESKKYVPSEQKKADQKAMDKLVIFALKNHAKKNKIDPVVLEKYLKAMWGLRRHQFPHSTRF